MNLIQIFLPVINKHQSSVQMASWRPDIWQSDRSPDSLQCESLYWKKKKRDHSKPGYVNKSNSEIQSEVVFTSENWNLMVMSWWPCGGISFVPQPSAQSPLLSQHLWNTIDLSSPHRSHFETSSLSLLHLKSPWTTGRYKTSWQTTWNKRILLRFLLYTRPNNKGI